MTKKQRITDLKKLREDINELLLISSLQSNTLEKQLSSIDQQLQDLGALPVVKRITESDRKNRNKTRLQIIGK